jgi:hypothetical protein
VALSACSQIVQQLLQQIGLPPQPRQPPLQNRQQRPPLRPIELGDRPIPQQQHPLHQHQAGRRRQQAGQAVAVLRLQCRQQHLEQRQVGAAAEHHRLQLALQGPLLLLLGPLRRRSDRLYQAIDRARQARQPGRLVRRQRRLQQTHQRQPACAGIIQGRAPLQARPAQAIGHGHQPGLAAVQAAHQGLQQPQPGLGVLLLQTRQQQWLQGLGVGRLFLGGQ